jgi:hypothetical protein
MERKHIIITVIVGLLVLGVTIGIMYFAYNKKSSLPKETAKKIELKVGNYTLKYGKYKGQEVDYNPDSVQVHYKDVYLELTETMIIINDNKQTYKIEDNKIVSSSGIEYEVIANNKIRLLAGGGVEYEYQE